MILIFFWDSKFDIFKKLFWILPEEEDAESQIKDGAAVGSQGSQTLCPILLASWLLNVVIFGVWSCILHWMEDWNPKCPQALGFLRYHGASSTTRPPFPLTRLHTTNTTTTVRWHMFTELAWTVDRRYMMADFNHSACVANNSLSHKCDFRSPSSMFIQQITANRALGGSSFRVGKNRGSRIQHKSSKKGVWCVHIVSVDLLDWYACTHVRVAACL